MPLRLMSNQNTAETPTNKQQVTEGEEEKKELAVVVKQEP
jgi:hypothetical protein